MNELQTIMGGPSVPAQRLVDAIQRRTPMYPIDLSIEIALAYTAYGNLAGTGNLIPFAQAVHETGFFLSQWFMAHNNPAGIGVTGAAGAGSKFETATAGIVAHLAHLIAYAVQGRNLTDNQRLLLGFDPRLAAMQKAGFLGIAPRWIDLNGRWAVPGRTYGQKILQIAGAIAG